ncbi:MFS transporter [Qipengyuania marisflavi]|uniref:MFS transporter n=1 Tax=Qipengyuania marisflavi TaxID=2486356 RepID=A0A5S3P6F6_9SPHN|nr:MFS transporter [Qipengyuania marisflavi]TMM48750.1 MFS transporter [Qipengyuania marisflavi]
MQIIVEDENFAFRRYLWMMPAFIPSWILGGMFLRYFAIYATDVLLLAPAMLGTVMLISRVFDGVTDPIFGWLSDRRKAPRRVPFYLVGTLGTLSMLGIWIVPEHLTGLALAAWLTMILLIWETGQTLRTVAFGALGFEVATTARRRTMTMVLSGIAALIGSVIGIFVMQYLLNHPDPRSAVVPIVLIVVPLSFAATFLMGLRLKELPKPHRSEERPPIHMMREVLANKYHRQYIGIQMAETFAYVSIGFAVPYVMQYTLGRPDMTMYIYLTNLIIAVVSGGGWWLVVGRLGTRRTWLAGQYVWLVTLAMWPLVLVFGLPAFFVLAFLGGIGSAAGSCVGYAMLGDIADYDAKVSGRQRQGVYATIYGFVGKIAAALTAFLLGWMLQLAGYMPNQEQGPNFTIAMTMTIAVLPGICMLASVRLLHRYRLYEDEGIDDGRVAAAQPEMTPARA